MTRAALEILESIDRLPVEEREEVLSLLLRKAAMAEHQGATDDELVESAALVFAELERSENEQ